MVIADRAERRLRGWATYTGEGTITAATPTPSAVFDPDLTTKPLVVGDLLEWVHLRISANDPSPLAGGIEGFSYKVEGFPGGAATWTVKDGDTRAAADDVLLPSVTECTGSADRSTSGSRRPRAPR